MTAVGERIDGKYIVRRRLGVGGMSVVWLAEDLRLGKEWAVKELRLTGDPKRDALHRTSMLQEARRMKNLNHPGIPRIVDILELSSGLFIVMDVVEGRPLSDILAERGPGREREVRDWGIQTAEILAYLHGRRPPLLYRDLKPANLILGADGRIRLVDFGIVRPLPEANDAVGTKRYAAPEQVRGLPQDERTDLYSLGVTLRECLEGLPGTGRPARGAWQLRRIISRLTDSDPRRRYASAGETAAALRGIGWQGWVAALGRAGRRRCLVLGILALLAGLLLLGIPAVHRERALQRRLQISDSTPVKEREASYLAAIDRAPARMEAYQKLLGLYLEDGALQEEESRRFLACYNAHKDRWDVWEEAVWQLCFRMGQGYLRHYTGGDASFRTRLLMALPYFQNVADYADLSAAYYDRAKAYAVLGSFYSRFVVGGSEIREPKEQDYRELREALLIALAENPEEEGEEDSAYFQLSLIREMGVLLADIRRGLAEAGISRGEMEQLLERMERQAEAQETTRQATMELKQEVLEEWPGLCGEILQAFEAEEETASEEEEY